MKARSLLVTFLCLSTIPSAFGDGKRQEVQVAFRRPGMGIGGGETSDIVIGNDDDKYVSTCAILKAVLAVQAGFVHEPEAGLEAKQAYKTDYSKLSADDLTEYNRQNADWPLAPGPLYGVVYEVSYEVLKGFVKYDVKSTLSYSGSRSAQWYEYKKKYNDTYFSKRLLTGIDQRVAACAKPK